VKYKTEHKIIFNINADRVFLVIMGFIGGLDVNHSRDITLIIMLSVITLIFRFLISRTVAMIQIPGFIYVLSIFFSIIQSLAFLLFKGKRWRLFTLGVLSTLLFMIFINPTFRANEMAILLNYFSADIIFNSFYRRFEQKSKLLSLTIIFQLYYWIAYAFWILILTTALFIPFERFMQNWFVPVMSVMLPVIIIEALAGSFIGYKIYRRVEKLLY